MSKDWLINKTIKDLEEEKKPQKPLIIVFIEEYCLRGYPLCIEKKTLFTAYTKFLNGRFSHFSTIQSFTKILKKLGVGIKQKWFKTETGIIRPYFYINIDLKKHEIDKTELFPFL